MTTILQVIGVSGDKNNRIIPVAEPACSLTPLACALAMDLIHLQGNDEGWVASLKLITKQAREVHCRSPFYMTIAHQISL
ncbi:MAG: hypothetical protein V7676_13000 [Parasphingorhabdus sp.]|uniref:hypothetical protein n=1 Tax=Parasphingorhabdus sp. TaxID=2709688 RepID=UPI00300200E7